MAGFCQKQKAFSATCIIGFHRNNNPTIEMHIDARTLQDNSIIEGDICIIGAGPAGISIALDWANTRHSVIILEGGGFEVDNRMQEMYRGDSVGQKYYPLQSARLHYFGGTSGHWGGLC